MYRFEHGYFEESARYVRGQCGEAPLIALMLGSGLGALADAVENAVRIPYSEIPHFLVSTNPAHAGELVCGRISGIPVVCMSGRFHYYEGYDYEQLTCSVRLFHDLGARAAVLTNAAGAVNRMLQPGDLMIIRDHINLVGASPMRGPNVDEYGERFFDASQIYTPQLRKIALRIASQQKLRAKEGVYYFMPGPHYETPAEIRAIRVLGGDAVGMSTVPEALTAAHCGMPVLGISVITNMAAGIEARPLSDEDVRRTSGALSDKLCRYVTVLTEQIAACL